jgi:hypothetical protein
MAEEILSRLEKLKIGPFQLTNSSHKYRERWERNLKEIQEKVKSLSYKDFSKVLAYAKQNIFYFPAFFMDELEVQSELIAGNSMTSQNGSKVI